MIEPFIILNLVEKELIRFLPQLLIDEFGTFTPRSFGSTMILDLVALTTRLLLVKAKAEEGVIIINILGSLKGWKRSDRLHFRFTSTLLLF